MPVIPATPSPLFDQPDGFPLASDALAATSGGPPSEAVLSNYLGMEPEIRVDVEKALEDLNVLVVGPVERV